MEDLLPSQGLERWCCLRGERSRAQGRRGKEISRHGIVAAALPVPPDTVLLHV